VRAEFGAGESGFAWRGGRRRGRRLVEPRRILPNSCGGRAVARSGLWRMAMASCRTTGAPRAVLESTYRAGGLGLAVEPGQRHIPGGHIDVAGTPARPGRRLSLTGHGHRLRPRPGMSPNDLLRPWLSESPGSELSGLCGAVIESRLFLRGLALRGVVARSSGRCCGPANPARPWVGVACV
jgi:hypothetical protein